MTTVLVGTALCKDVQHDVASPDAVLTCQLPASSGSGDGALVPVSDYKRSDDCTAVLFDFHEFLCARPLPFVCSLHLFRLQVRVFTNNVVSNSGVLKFVPCQPGPHSEL